MFVNFANVPVSVDADGNVDPSVLRFALWLRNHWGAKETTIQAYIHSVSLFVDYTSICDALHLPPPTLPNYVPGFIEFLQQRSDSFDWSTNQNYIRRILYAVSLFLQYLDIGFPSLDTDKKDEFRKMAKKRFAFLGHIRKGKTAELADSDSTPSMDIPKGAIAEIKYFPLNRFWDFIDALPTHRDRALHLLMAGTSARLGQALNVCQGDILFDEARVVFIDPRSSSRAKELKQNYNLRPTAVYNKSFLPGIWLPHIRDRFFEEAKLYRTDEFIPEDRRPQRHPYFFVTRSGRRLMPRQVEAQFKTICHKLGIEGMTPHSLRHLYGYFCHFALGVPLHILMHLMGHANISSTLVYATLPSEIVRGYFEEAFERIRNRQIQQIQGTAKEDDPLIRVYGEAADIAFNDISCEMRALPAQHRQFLLSPMVAA